MFFYVLLCYWYFLNLENKPKLVKNFVLPYNLTINFRIFEKNGNKDDLLLIIV